VRLLQPNRPWGDGYVPAPFTHSGNTLFFVGPDIEPWKSDGTPQGTVRLKDIQPGEFVSSGTRFMAGEGGNLFFVTTSGDLWKSDGTEAGTVLVQPFPYSQMQVQSLDTLGSTALIVVSTQMSTQGAPQLWKSDGTAAGTQMVAELTRLNNPYETWKTTVVGGRLFLSSSQALWVSDGTASGTRALTSLTTSTSMVGLEGKLLFAQGSTLWRSDGPDGGVVQVAQVPQDQFISTLLAQGSQAYFLTLMNNSGTALWKTDGTAAGTVQVKAFAPNANGGLFLSPLRGDGGLLFFDRSDGTSLQTWMSDGTEAGTRLLTSTLQEPQGSWPGAWTALDGSALFLAEEGLSGPSLWRTEGTAAGTTAVKVLEPLDLQLGQPRPAPATVRFGGSVFLYSGNTLWKSDGTVAGTLAVRRFANLWNTPELVQLGDALYFTASDGGGPELWKSDGTEAGTVRVKAINPQGFGSSPHDLRVMGGALYFIAMHAKTDQDLWKTDGTEAGTVLVKNLEPASPLGSRLFSLHVAGNALYFRYQSGQLWRSDGTEAGTQPLPLLANGYFDSFHPLDAQTLYFQALNPSGDTPQSLLFKLEGGADAVQVWRTSEGNWDAVRGGFAHVRGGDVFMAWDKQHGLELWRTDGTQEGTALLKDLWPGPDSGIRQDKSPEVLTLEDQGLVLFAASDGESGEELWQTDGTPEGTLRVADLRPGPGGSVPRGLTRLGDTVLFSAVDEAAGVEPHALPVPVWTDRSPPTLTCPADVKARASESSGTAVAYPPATATDLSGTPTVQYSHASGSLFPVGTTEVTVTATDAVGLSRQCTFSVEVTRSAQDSPSPFGCDCNAGGAGPVALWSLLALLAGAVRRRRL
jgi:MYXO-CTERM domain-containing protein